MDDFLLDGLQTASYNGVEFLVQNSSIKFGQKTVTHHYPNSNRTEVEQLGLALDEFNLDIIIFGTGDDYFTKRKKLKDELSKQGKIGILIHPVEGTVNCRVVGRPEITENQKELGIARFSVTFQKCNEKLYPTASSDVTGLVQSGVLGTLAAIEDKIGEVKSSFVESYTALKTKLVNVADVFDAAKKTISITTEQIDDVSNNIQSFRNNINRVMILPQSLAKSITGLMNTLYFVTNKPLDNITFYRQLYNFGDDEKEQDPITAQNIEINNNKAAIDNAIQAGALAMSYGLIVNSDFATQEELDYNQAILDEQYNAIYEGLDSDILRQLSLLRANANQYLNGLDLASIVKFNTPPTGLSVLCFNLYGSLDNCELLRTLNRFDNSTLVEGDVSVIQGD